jgi:type III secretion protein L
MDLVVLSALPTHVLAVKGAVIKGADATRVLPVTDALAMAKQLGVEQNNLVAQAMATAHHKGLLAGRAQAAAEYAGKLAKAEAARHAALRELQPALVDMVIQAVEVVVRQQDRQQLLVSALNAVDGLIRQARWARLRVHPSAAEAARAALAQTVGGMSPNQIVSVIPDAEMDVDGCVFETDIGMADGSLNVQLRALRVAVQAAFAALSSSTDASTAQPLDEQV